MCSIYETMPPLKGIGMVSEPIMLMEYKKWLMDRMGNGCVVLML